MIILVRADLLNKSGASRSTAEQMCICGLGGAAEFDVVPCRVSICGSSLCANAMAEVHAPFKYDSVSEVELLQ